MPTPSNLNIEQLLEPIAGDGSAAGPDLRLDYSPGAIYQQIRDARETSRGVERQMLESNPDYGPDQLVWKEVVDLGKTVLAENSKDLQIAAWLCEALLRTKGFGGLRDGFLLSRKLCQDYWTGLYPQPEEEEDVEPPTDEDKVTTRIKPFEGLFTGALAQAINNVEITEGERYTFTDRRQGIDLEKESDKAVRESKLDAGVVSYGDFSADAASSSVEFYQLMHDDLTDCIAEFTKFVEVLEKKCGKDEKGFDLSPPTSDMIKVFDACLKTVTELCKDKGLLQEEPEVIEGELEGAGQLVPAGQRGGVGGGFTREDAFKQLTILAEFFRRSEPHSPVSHHIEEAVRWGRMALPELLAELITDDKIRQAVYTRVGIGDSGGEKGK